MATAQDILDSCRFFGRIQGSGRQRLLDMGIVRRYAKGHMIFRQDDPCPGIFVVGQGLVRVFKTAPSGKEHVLHLIPPGMLFAEVAAIGQFACPAFAEALEPSTCLLLPTEPFHRALRQDHELCRQLLLSMTFWVRHFLGLMEDIVLRDAAGRVARYLLDARAELDGSLSLQGLKKHLASHLNLTSETLSRTLRRFLDAGLIAESDRRLQIVDEPGLQDVAEGLVPSV